MSVELAARITRIKGPILVLGAGGFIGANLLKLLLRHRPDAIGVARTRGWRLEEVENRHLLLRDLLSADEPERVMRECAAGTVFNCMAYGGYPFQTEEMRMYETNFMLTARLLEAARKHSAHYIHAGTSSEYGDNAPAPREDAPLLPNSAYAASKAAASQLISFYGRKHGLYAVNLRLYSVYGPYEEPSRLMPTLIRHGLEGTLPEFVAPETSRDFVHVGDACAAFAAAAAALPPEHYGASINIGTGVKTTIGELAELARELFSVDEAPRFTGAETRSWDRNDWYSNPALAAEILGWQSTIGLREGVERTAEWYRAHPDAFLHSCKTASSAAALRLSIIVACYRDAQAIPLIHEGVVAAMRRVGMAYELIFVNDCSPDESEEVIRALSARDVCVRGITHARNFGSQAAFLSGMELAQGDACVLMDGDLQDPPELIPAFIEQWRHGFDVVYGRRVARQAPFYMQIACKLFYRVFAACASIPIPRDAGDFSLIDRKVMRHMLSFPERDIFLRGIRAYAGFRQTGVDYKRPERRFGRSTNNLWRNLWWTKKAVFAFSNKPLEWVSGAGAMALCASALLLLASVAGIAPVAPWHAVAAFLAAANLFAIGLVGEYVGKMIEEVRRRPRFIRARTIAHGALIEHE